MIISQIHSQMNVMFNVSKFRNGFESYIFFEINDLVINKKNKCITVLLIVISVRSKIVIIL